MGNTQRPELVSIRNVLVHRDEIQKTAITTLFGLFEFPFTRIHGNQYALRRQRIVNKSGKESSTKEEMLEKAVQQRDNGNYVFYAVCTKDI